MKIYLNGVLSNTTSSEVPSSLMNNNYSTLIGRDDDNADRWFNGKISISLIYDKALTELEVKQNYNSQKGRFGK